MQVQQDPGMQSYAQDLDWGRKAASLSRQNFEEELHYLPYLWRYTLLRCSLKSQAEQYPDEAFRLMVSIGNDARALKLVKLIRDPIRQVKILLLVATALREAGKTAESLQLLLNIHAVASAISDKWEQAVGLQDLAAALAQQQEWSAAERVIASIAEERHQAEARRDLALALARCQ